MKSIRLDYDKIQDCLVIRRLNYKRFSFHGFGSFIWQAKKEDISLSPEALKALKARIGRSSSLGDLAGASFEHNDTAADKNQRGFIVNYGFKGPYLEVPMEDVVIDMDSYQVMEKCVEKEPDVTKVEQQDLTAWQQLMEAEENGDEDKSKDIESKFYSREEIP